MGQNWDNRPFVLEHTLIVRETEKNGTRIILAADYGRRRSEHGKGTDGFRSALQCKAAEV